MCPQYSNIDLKENYDKDPDLAKKINVTLHYSVKPHFQQFLKFKYSICRSNLSLFLDRFFLIHGLNKKKINLLFNIDKNLLKIGSGSNPAGSESSGN